MPDLQRELMDVVYAKSFELADKMEKKGYNSEEAEEIAERILVDTAIDHLNELDDGIVRKCVEEELNDVKEVK